MATPEKKASPAPVESFMSTFLAGQTPAWPSAVAQTAPREPMVTTMRGRRAICTLLRSTSVISSTERPSYSSENRMPASWRLQTKQAVERRKSRRSTAMLMLDTTAYTGFWYFSANWNTRLTMSLSMSISMQMLSAWENSSSPRFSRTFSSGVRSGRLDTAATTSPSLSNTASHVPMPSRVGIM